MLRAFALAFAIFCLCVSTSESFALQCNWVFDVSKSKEDVSTYESMSANSEGSFRSDFPDIYEELSEAYTASKNIDSFDFADPRTQHNEVHIKEVITIASQEVGEFLTDLAHNASSKRHARASALSALLEKYAFTFRSLLDIRHKPLSGHTERSQEEEDLLSHALKFRSLWSELMCAMIVPRLYGASELFGDFISQLRRTPSYRFLDPVRPRSHDFNTEIDLIWQQANGTYVWGEVKTLGRPLRVDSDPKSNWMRLVTRAKEHMRMINNAGLDMEYHVHLPGGCENDAAMKLRQIGIRVDSPSNGTNRS